MMHNNGPEMNRSQNGFTLDTCVVINILKNPTKGAKTTCRLNFENSDIHICSQVIFEAKEQRQGYAIDFKEIQSIIKAKIIIGSVTNDMQKDAKRLEKACSTLHKGDSQILAYARATGTTLVTCDQDFEKAAIKSNTRVINPDRVITEGIKKEMNLPKEKLLNISQKIADVEIEDIECVYDPYFEGNKPKYQRRIHFFLKNGGEIIVLLVRLNSHSYIAIWKSSIYSTTKNDPTGIIGRSEALLCIIDLWNRKMPP